MMKLQTCRVHSCATGFSSSPLGSASSLNQHLSETNRMRKRIAPRLLAAIAAAFLLSLTPKLLFAQQMYSAPYYAQPTPYSGQYAPPVQRPVYSQPQYTDRKS